MREYLLYMSIVTCNFQAKAYGVDGTLEKDTLKILSENGHLVVLSDGCEGCQNNWLSWLGWSTCDIPVPGNPKDIPQCYNSLQNRQRTCNDTTLICKQFDWRLCLHNESCTGQWSMWSNLSSTCSQECMPQTRNRTCVHDGKVAPGLCYPSAYAIQYDIITEECTEDNCKSYAYIYPAVFGVKFMLLVVGAAMTSRRRMRHGQNQVRRRAGARKSLSYRHYSFAVEIPALNEIELTVESAEHIYEYTNQQSRDTDDIQPYSSAYQIETQEADLYEVPIKTAPGMKPHKQQQQQVTGTETPKISRARSLDNILSHTNAYPGYTEIPKGVRWGRQQSMACIDSDHYYCGANEAINEEMPQAVSQKRSACFAEQEYSCQRITTNVPADYESYTAMKSPVSTAEFGYPNRKFNE